MAYCVAADLFNLLPEITVRALADPYDDLDEATEDSLIDEHIEMAAREIDSYLSIGGYTVPISSPPAILKDWNASLALCSLLRHRGYNADSADQVLVERCVKVREILEKIAADEWALPGVDSGDAPSSPKGIRSIPLQRV